jgi:hypothetical protein
MSVHRITPVHIVDRIEPTLPFWAALGFQVLAQVPHGEALGFVLLAAGDVQVMLQTMASVAADVPAIARLQPTTVLYVNVDSLAGALAKVPSAELVMSERKAPYGPLEAAVRTPSGHVVMLAQDG